MCSPGICVCSVSLHFKAHPRFCLRTGLLFILDAVYEKFLISEVFFCIEIMPQSDCLFLFRRRSNRPCLPLEDCGTGYSLLMREPSCELINRLLGFAIPTLAFKNYHLLYMGKKGRGCDLALVLFVVRKLQNVHLRSKQFLQSA